MNQTNAQKIVFKIVAIILFLLNPFLLMAQEHKITIQEKNISIENAFIQIEKQTDYSIAYDRSKIDLDKKVSLSLKNASLAKALSDILKDTKLSYKINGYHIILIPKKDIEPETKKTKLTQTIRGVVTDNASGRPIPYATVVLLNTDPMRGTTTDSMGLFRFDKVSIGRYDIQVSVMGYESNITKEVLLTSAKESYNEIKLKERILILDDIVVRPTVNKEKTLNSMALAGGRMFSVEETSRFAGGFDDPARLVTSFAGVSGTTSNNSISIRGNSPQFLQWKLEGVEIPNPTHFADMVQVGGGIISGLSSQVMGNSDFFTGTFPAEYSNALSGIFDMSLRNGNNQEHEHTVQVGVLGIDLASEGPINKKTGSSYIINYRYSVTGLVSELTNDLNLKFQDLSFKLNFPTRKAGTFSIWGLGLTDNYGTAALDDPTMWESMEDRQNHNIDVKKFITGMDHMIFVGKSAYIKSSFAATYSDFKLNAEILELNEPFSSMPLSALMNQEWNLTFNSYFNKKFSAHHTNRTGIAITGLFYDLDFKGSPTSLGPTTPTLEPMEQFAKGNASNTQISVFSNSLINITDRLSTNVGLTGLLFTLNNSWSIEPRISLKYQVTSNHSIAMAYGLHSKRDKLDYYYIKLPETGDKLVNKDLTFAKANNFVLSYDWNITDNIHLRVEPYYQSLFDVPVESETSFSIINHDLFYLLKPLINTGKGYNYGIDITIERYLNKGYYWLLTGSFFDSKYMGGDNVWRNTKYNRKFIVNGLIGKEWMCGKSKQNVLSANVRLTYQGGQYYTPVDIKASEVEKNTGYFDNRANTVYLNDKAYSEQFSPTLTADLTVSYKINRKKVSHEIAVKILNISGTTEQFYRYYDSATKTVETYEAMIVLPNISYKIHF